MKKFLLFLLLPLLLCSSCAIDPYVLPRKTYKSESPYIYISQTSLYGGYKGEIKDENGEIIEVIAEFHHGIFGIFVYVPNAPEGLGEELLWGDYRYHKKENILVFYCDNGDEITLIPLEDETK
ncbi:MAG: hypothetical protein J6A85_00385 [Clostridia bacterium]|nr:hypothetical protein [Clostridia bacterium]